MIKELHNILDKFTKPNFLIEGEIHERIKKFIKENFKDNELPENSPLKYEKIAFAFDERENAPEEEENDPEEWGNLFYGPLMRKIDPTTKKYQSSYPDIKQITL